MITSKSSVRGDGESPCANVVNTIVSDAPSQKKFRFIAGLTVSNSDLSAKRRFLSARKRPRQRQTYSPRRASKASTSGSSPRRLADFTRAATGRGGGFESYSESLNTECS